MRPTQSALILSLRRLAEVEAKRQLGLTRAQLERARRSEAQAQQRVVLCEQQLAQRTAGQRAVTGPAPDRGAVPRALPAAALGGLSDAVRVARAQRAELARQHKAELAQVTRLAREVERLEELWRLAVARREAAERHEEEQRRAERRARMLQQRAHEDEARERFASARRTRPRARSEGEGER